MLHYETIEPKTLDILKKIQSSAEYRGTRLVGGTALALQLGHRVSVDLDLFGRVDATTEEQSCSLGRIGKEEIVSQGNNINVFLLDGVKVDIVNYPYGWVDDVIEEDGIRLASFNDIAAMKVSAICNRGTKKDFIDIYFLLKIFDIREILSLYLKKYPDGSEFIALKSLTYFEDAESNPMPQMLVDVDWDTVKTTVSRAVLKVTAQSSR